MKYFLLLLFLSGLGCNAQEIYNAVINMPCFKEGKLTVFLTDRMKYPAQARKANIVGRIFVRFVVDSCGKVTEPEIFSGGIPALNDEAFRLVELTSGHWHPGTLWNDKPVCVRYIVPITFSLPSLRKHKSRKKIRRFIRHQDSLNHRPFFVSSEPMTNIHGYIRKNLRYPPEARAKRMEGEVYVNFTVDTLGQVSQLRVVNPVDSLLDKESIRILQTTSGKWKPGKYKGKKTAMPCGVPVHFRLPDTDDTYLLTDDQAAH